MQARCLSSRACRDQFRRRDGRCGTGVGLMIFESGMHFDFEKAQALICLNSQLGRFHHFLCQLLHWSVLLPTNRCLRPFATPNCNYLPGEASVNKSVYTPWHAAIRFSSAFRMHGQTSSLLHRKLILIQSCQILPLENFDGSCILFVSNFWNM